MQDPQKYEEFKSAPGRDIKCFVPMLIEEMTWNNEIQTILDYGCGAGSVAKEFFVPKALEFSSEIYGIDCSENMIKFAKNNNHHSSIQYLVGNIMDDENILLKGKAFDKIFSIYVLHFIKDYKKALSRFYDILTPGGQFGFTIATKVSPLWILEYINQNPKWSPYVKGYEELIPLWFGAQEKAEIYFRNALTEYGFEINKLETHDMEYLFEDIEVLVEVNLSLNPFLGSIPSHLHPELKDDYRKLIAQRHGLDPCLLGLGSLIPLTEKYEVLYGLVTRN